MNFRPLTVGARTFTPEEQATAFEAYIQQDGYLGKHRGQYAERNGVVMPMFHSLDLSLSQDLFRNIGDTRNGFQVRLDIINFGNLLNNKWGVAQRPVGTVNTNQQYQILTNPGVDAQGRANYQPGRGEQRADHEIVPELRDDRRRLADDAQPALQLQLGATVRRRPGLQTRCQIDEPVLRGRLVVCTIAWTTHTTPLTPTEAAASGQDGGLSPEPDVKNPTLRGELCVADEPKGLGTE